MGKSGRRKDKTGGLKRSELLRRETRLLEPGGRYGIRAAVAFPNAYAVGMSNLGFQQVYRIFCEQEGYQAERLFLPPEGGRPQSIEEGEPLGGFRIVGFSVTYEVDEFHVIRMLRDSGVPIRSADRGDRDPFVILGGMAVTANPRPLSPLADMIVLGDAEGPAAELLRVLAEPVAAGGSRREVLAKAAEVDCVYVPLIHGRWDEASVERYEAPDLDAFSCRSVILTPETVFADMFLTEITRGCRRGCRFCLTGWMTPNLRVRSREKVVSEIRGFGEVVQKVGLVGAELTSHPEIEGIVEDLVRMGKKVSLSSAEVDRVSPRLLDLLVEGGLESLTIAPEAGSRELRRFLHKSYSEEEILSATRRAGEAGIPNLKVYFVVGLPETTVEEEADPIIDLVRKMREAFGGRWMTVSLSPLVPKPFTPIGKKHGMRPASEIRKIISRARKGVSRFSGLKMQAQSIREAEIDYRICQGSEDLFEWMVS